MAETAAAPNRRLRPLVELTRARVLEFLREPGALFWVFVFPVLLAVALGVAFRDRPPEPLRVAVTGEPAAVAWGLEALAGGGRLTPLAFDREAAREALRTGRVELVVEVSGPGPEPRFDYLFDPDRPDGRSARQLADDALQRALGRRDPAAVADRAMDEPGGRYVDFLLPGLIGLNLMGSSMWGIGFSVIQARTRKLLKRYAATPMRRSDYLLSLGLSRLVFLVLELAALVGFGWWVFGVAVRGSFAAFATIALLGGFAFTGLSLLVAARPRSQEAAAGWMNLVMLPMWVLSGSFFSASRFPDAAQPFIRALPLTALNDALRAVMNEGAALATVAPEMAVLAVWSAVSFVVALKIFRWQ
jgi:ABC-type multidrug transport system permease subunit